MKFSIQGEGKEKQFFVNFQEAENATGIPRNHIFQILRRDNPNYRRRSDGKRFVIKKENEQFALIDGKEFSTMEEVAREFGISRTRFVNQLLRGESFLDATDRSHEVNWRSEELKKCLDNLRQWRQTAKCLKNLHIKTAFTPKQKGEMVPSHRICLSESLLR